MLRREHSAFLPAPSFFALTGLVFCLWNLWSAGQNDVLCLSAGCGLFSDFTFAGVSLWWVGVAGFGLLLLLAVVGWLYLGLLVATLGVLLDCMLLAVMLSSAPCIPCLVAGLLLFLVFFLLLMHARNRKRGGWQGVFSFFIFFWSAIFVANIGVLAQGTLEPWAIQHAREQQGSIRVFFSPSCPACRELVSRIPEEFAARVTWYPVAENENDVRVIGALEKLLESNHSLPGALAEATRVPLGGQWRLVQPDLLMLQLRLWRNHAHVVEGEGVLPLIEISGVPAFMLSPQTVQQGAPAETHPPNVRVQPDMPPALPAEPAPASTSAPGADLDAETADGEDEPELIIEMPPDLSSGVPPTMPSELDIVGGCGPDQPDGTDMCY